MKTQPRNIVQKPIYYPGKIGYGKREKRNSVGNSRENEWIWEEIVNNFLWQWKGLFRCGLTFLVLQRREEKAVVSFGGSGLQADKRTSTSLANTLRDGEVQRPWGCFFGSACQLVIFWGINLSFNNTNKQKIQNQPLIFKVSSAVWLPGSFLGRTLSRKPILPLELWVDRVLLCVLLTTFPRKLNDYNFISFFLFHQ